MATSIFEVATFLSAFRAQAARFSRPRNRFADPLSHHPRRHRASFDSLNGSPGGGGASSSGLH
ncbi:protein of unknown function [Microbacterium sp. Nx66]|nr:protein of unknown function [Microbacterium sp. Nx66]